MTAVFGLVCFVGCDRHLASVNVRAAYPDSEIWTTSDHTFIVRKPNGEIYYCSDSGAGGAEIPVCVLAFPAK